MSYAVTTFIKLWTFTRMLR